MAARNYQPTLRRLANHINRFSSKYQALILAGMTPDQAAVFTAFLVVLEELVTALGTGSGV
jgi:adenylosuccinate lyase